MTMGSEVPIIVGGCHRSGTSLFRRMLNAHSRIHCGPEVTFFRDFYSDYRHDPLAHLRFTRTARSLVAEELLLESLGQTFVLMHERAAAIADKPRWADKSPDNVLYLGQWKALLAGRLSFVQVVRSPLDTVASMRAAGFPLTFPEGFDDLVQMYRRYTESGLDFVESYPELSYVLVYERLVTDPAAELARVMTHLGEPAEGGQLDFNAQPHGRGLEDPKVGLTTTVHAKSLDGWRALLTPDEADIVRRATAGLAARVAALAGESAVTFPQWQQ